MAAYAANDARPTRPMASGEEQIDQENVATKTA
jgi:hypothetical protein